MTAHGQSVSSPVGWAQKLSLLALLLFYAQGLFAAPYSHTRPVTLATPTGATLNGTAVPNGSASVAWFEWGSRGSYNQTTSSIDVGSASTVVQVSAPITGLTNGEQYQCRLVVSNATGVTYGRMVLFTTGQKVLAWRWYIGSYYGQTNLPPNLTNVTGIAAGREHSFATLNDGTSIGWGRNDYGQSTVPAQLTNLVAIAGSSYTSAAVRSDGSVIAWGDSRTNFPTALTNAIAVAGGLAHLLGLRADGKVFAWGYNSDGQTNVPAALSNVVAIAGGDYFSLALTADGRVGAWGNSIGNAPAGLSNVIAIAAGYLHGLALKSDGKVVAWGSNASGQTNVPSGLSNVVAVAAGQSYSMALTADGDIVTWGYASNTNGPGALAKCVALVSGSDHSVELGNRAPRADAKNFSGPANQDLVLSLSGSDINGDAISFRVISLPASGSLYQYAGGIRGAPILSPGAIVSDAQRRLIYVPATNGSGDPFATFNHVANDGKLDSALATITIQIIAKPYAATQPPAGFSSNSLVLAGMVVPNGMPAKAWFEWGLNTNYGFSTLATNMGAGTGVMRVTQSISNLFSSGIYHYRLVASNVTAVTYGPDQIATTGSKVTAWGENDSGETIVPSGLNGVVAVDGGSDHSLALTRAGQVIAWGSNASGQTNIPPGLSNAVAIAAGAHHNLALRTDGTVTAWGLNTGSQTNVPSGLSNVVAIAAGGFHSLALREDGTVLVWGNANYGNTNIPSGLSNVVAISGGWYYSTALRADGTIATWGTPFYQETNVPPGLSNLTRISSGWTHQMAMRRDAAPVGWGYGPTNVPNSFSNLNEISCGNNFNVGLTADETVVAWGTGASATAPSNLSPAGGIMAGIYHGLALANRRPLANSSLATGVANQDLLLSLSASDVNGETLVLRVISLPSIGALYQFTTNGRGAPITSPQTVISDSAGRLIFVPATNGFGSPYDSFNFVANDGDLDSLPGTMTVNMLGELRVATQAAGVMSSTNAKLNGMVLPNGAETVAWYEWGTNSGFSLTTLPASAGSGGKMVRIEHSVSGLQPNLSYHFRLVASNANGIVRGAHKVFTTGKKVAAWGYNGAGQADAPPGLANVTSVAGGGIHSLAVLANGSVRAWGSGAYSGQVTNVPVSASNVVAVSAGSSHSLALRQDGTAVAWGYMNYGYPYVPSDLSNVVAIASGADHDLALRSDGSVVAWGVYGYNQTVVPAGLSNVIAVAAGYNRTLAVRADGTVVIWGDNYSNWLTPPAGLTNVADISDSGSHTLALKTDGTVVAWGDNSYSQTNVPAGLSNVVAIVCTAGYNLALKSDGQITTWGNSPSAGNPPPLTGVTAVGAGGANLAVGDNLLPIAFTQAASGLINQDLVITLSGDDFNGDVLTYRIAALPTKGQLYQCVSGARGSPIMAGGTVTDLLARVVFVPATNEFGRPYASFNFLVNDGTVDSPAATVTIHITSPTFAVTRAVTRSTATSAMLNGVANAGHLPTSVWFEWGSSRAYGQVTATQQLAAGNQLAWLSASVMGLAAQSVYHCRLVASNAGGIAFGANRVFTTGRRAVTWDTRFSGAPTFPIGPTNAVAISGGYTHTITLRNNGTLEASGDNTYGQSAIPTNLTGVVQVDAGAYHNLALKSDGTVAAWGSSLDSQTNVPPGLTGVQQIACGPYHSVALKSNGTVVAWGWNQYGQTQVPPTLTDAVAVAAGFYNGVALRSNGTVVAWGGGGSYSTYTNIPAGLSNVVAIDSNKAIRSDGSVVMWGFSATVPTNWVDIVEIDGSLALKADSTIAGCANCSVDWVPPQLTNVAYISSGNNEAMVIGNLPPTALPQNLKHAANHDLTIQLNAADPQADPMSFRIVALPAKGNLYQFAGGGRGPQIVASGTLVEDTERRVVFVPAPNETGSPYTTFDFVANDGELDSAQAVVTVSIVANPYAATQPAAPVGPTNATLNGMAVANGFATRAWFEWGTNSAYNQTTAPIDIGSGARVVRLNSTLNNLPPGGIISFRLVASNAAGVAYGAPQWLATDRRLTAWGGNTYGQTNVWWNMKSVFDVTSDFGTSYAIKTDGSVSAWGYAVTNGLPALSNVISIGDRIALKGDGTVMVWGSNFNGETNMPPGLSNVVAIAWGGPHRLTLRDDGTVAAWGNNQYGQTNVPPGLSNVVAISAGNWFSAALKADGTVVAWGNNSSGETNVPSTLSNVVAITSGAFHSLALKSDGTVVVWGDNSNGSSQAVVPADATNVVAVACGYFHNLALRADGSVVTWGFNVQGALNKPSWVSNVVAVAAGDYHSVVLRGNRGPSASPQTAAGIANRDFVLNLSGSDPDGDGLKFLIKSLPLAGTLYQYTNGNRGMAITSTNVELTASAVIFAPDTNTFGNPYASFSYGVTDGEAESAPALVTISISGTAYAATLPANPVTTTSATLHGMAVSSGLPTFAWFEWGTDTSYGQSAGAVAFSGATQNYLTAVLTNLSPGVQYHFRLVATNATRSAFGANQVFQTGARVTTWGQNIYGLTNVPPGLSNLVGIAGGNTHSLVLLADGTVRAWGGGDPYYGGTAFTNVPANVSNILAIAAGDYHNVVLRSNRTVFAWGGYSYAGGPTSGEANVPPGLSNVVAISAGGSHTLALRTNGTVVAWGNNWNGQTNVPAGLSNIIGIAAGGTHSLALRIDGTVVGWGNNSSGQRTMPAGLTNVVAIAAGQVHSLALKADGTLAGWGVFSGFGSAAPPAGLSNIVKIAAGGNHALALRSDGTIRVWGYNGYGQTNIPSGLASIVEMKGGFNHTLTLGGNLAPKASSLVVTGLANTDLILSLGGTDPNGDLLNLRVLAPPTNGSLYQFTGGVRGELVATSNAVVTDSLQRLVFAPAANASGLPYANFGFIANDGALDSPPATVTIGIQPPVRPVFVSFSRATNNSCNIVFTGHSNTTYCAWASTNLVNWEALGLAAQTSPGLFQFSDAGAAALPQRFYRLSTACGAPAPQMNALSRFTNGGFNVRFSGGAYWTYHVWASTNLVHWELLGSSAETSPGIFRYLDSAATNMTQRFYKAVGR